MNTLVTEVNKSALKRWLKISLRTLHLLSLAGVGGGVLFGLDADLWLGYWWLSLVSGGLLMLVDIVSNPIWLVQVRGLVILTKLVLLALLGCYPDWDRLLLVVIIVMSAVVSHAPGALRYYSVYHQRVITSATDTKG